MSSTNIEQFIPAELAEAIANSLFPALDSQLRAGRHIGLEDLDNHAFLLDFQDQLEAFYQRYNAELIRAPEGFFYLRPRSTTLIARSVLSELDMLIGKVLCYLYLSPERLAQEGIFTQQDLSDELFALADENKLLKLINQRSTGSDFDRQKLQEKIRTSLNRLRRLGMVFFFGQDGQRFRISEAVFRFGADVRNGDDPRQAQLRLIREGEAMPIEKHLQLSDDPADESHSHDDIKNDNSMRLNIHTYQDLEENEPSNAIIEDEQV